MTTPITHAQLPYLHIDDLSVHVPATTDLALLNRELESAAARGKAINVQIVDATGKVVEALVSPGLARIIVASREPVIVPRKGQPDSLKR
jgi:hypothetical protein